MNKINFANVILVGAVVFLLGGISQVYASVLAAPNKTNITAEILSVQQIDSSSDFASNYVKILEIKVIKYESVEGSFGVPDEMKAYVHKRTNDLAIVDKLEKGQIITATISYFGGERGGRWDIREIKISTSTQTQCEIGKIYDSTAVSPISCSCPAGYQFETVEIGWGTCPATGMSDCPATKLKCVAKTGVPISTNEKPVPTSTSMPVKVEVTTTETAISGPQPTTAKLPVNCTRENETVTCLTSETKQISVSVMMSTNAPLEVITIQKQTDGTIGVISHGVVAVTTEKVTVEGNRLFVGTTESAKHMSVLPDEAKNTAITSAGLTSVETTKIKTEEQKPIYSVQGVRSSKLLFIIPVSIRTTTKIDATNGKVISIQKPWWSFLAR